MVDVKKLISFVKKYPILYDLDFADHKDVKKKDKVWDEIGLELNESGDKLKKKWKNLRDCYARCLQSEKSAASSTRYYRSWPWAKQMEMFKPFFRFAQTEANESSKSNSTLSYSPANEELSCEQQHRNNPLQQEKENEKKKLQSIEFKKSK